jgi:uncharacterized membrane protein
MADHVVHLLILLAALGSGLMAGVFFAFSTFVMQGLARLAPAQGMAAMQSINVTVLNPIFLAVFLGTALLCVSAVVVALMRRPAGFGLVIAGALLYLAGTFLVTVVFNVPRNEALARLEPAAAEASPAWSTYRRVWTRWNHVRTCSALAAAASFTLALT